MSSTASNRKKQWRGSLFLMAIGSAVYVYNYNPLFEESPTRPRDLSQFRLFLSRFPGHDGTIPHPDTLWSYDVELDERAETILKDPGSWNLLPQLESILRDFLNLGPEPGGRNHAEVPKTRGDVSRSKTKESGSQASTANDAEAEPGGPDDTIVELMEELEAQLPELGELPYARILLEAIDRDSQRPDLDARRMELEKELINKEGDLRDIITQILVARRVDQCADITNPGNEFSTTPPDDFPARHHGRPTSTSELMDPNFDDPHKSTPPQNSRNTPQKD